MARRENTTSVMMRSALILLLLWATVASGECSGESGGRREGREGREGSSAGCRGRGVALTGPFDVPVFRPQLRGEGFCSVIANYIPLRKQLCLLWCTSLHFQVLCMKAEEPPKTKSQYSYKMHP